MATVIYTYHLYIVYFLGSAWVSNRCLKTSPVSLLLLPSGRIILSIWASWSLPSTLNNLAAGRGPATLLQNRCQESLLLWRIVFLYFLLSSLTESQSCWFLRAFLIFFLHFYVFSPILGTTTVLPCLYEFCILYNYFLYEVSRCCCITVTSFSIS